MTTVNSQTYSYDDYLKLKKEFEEKDRKIESQLWIDRTIGQFDDLLRLNYNKSLEEFTSIVIRNIAEMTNAFSGVIYVTDQDKNVLRAIAGYACRIDNLQKQEFQIGEGLIGQAAISQKMLFFDNLPPEHTEVKLSSITINAMNVLIVPLIFNEKVYGVIELIHISTLDTKYINLLEKLNRNIAVMIESISNNALTQQLLVDSQDQTEKLRSQEEELRQNLEELSATQESLAKKEMEIRGQINAINMTLATIEFDMMGHILIANDLFLEIMGYTMDEIRGKHHKVFVDENYAKSQAYHNFWERLREGKSKSDEFFRIHRKGHEVWLRATYTPILNSAGVPVKVIKLALNITEQKQQSLDFEGKLFAISKSNALVEFSLQGEILMVNQIFLDLFNYEEHEVIGKHHRIFLTEEDAKSKTYLQFWENLKDGTFQDGEFKRKDKHGKTVWIRGSYNPILNGNGKPYKVIKVAQDVTHQKNLEMKLSQLS